MHKSVGVRQQHLDLTPLGETHQGGQILGFVLKSAGHLRRLQSRREMKIEVRKATLLSTPRAKRAGTKDIFN